MVRLILQLRILLTIIIHALPGRISPNFLQHIRYDTARMNSKDSHILPLIRQVHHKHIESSLRSSIALRVISDRTQPSQEAGNIDQRRRAGASLAEELDKLRVSLDIDLEALPEIIEVHGLECVGRVQIRCIEDEYIDRCDLGLDFLEDLAAALAVCNVGCVDVHSSLWMAVLELVANGVQGFELSTEDDYVLCSGYGEGCCDSFAYALSTASDEDSLASSREVWP